MWKNQLIKKGPRYDLKLCLGFDQNEGNKDEINIKTQNRVLEFEKGTRKGEKDRAREETEIGWIEKTKWTIKTLYWVFKWKSGSFI